MSAPTLFKPLTLGGKSPITLGHRLVMSPLTRNRATYEKVTTPLMTTYYQQRASKGGLLITEATDIMNAPGYPSVPGIYTAEHVEAWKPTTAAVHAKGGFIFTQLWHVGRNSHSGFQPDGLPPKAPSAIKIKDGEQTYVPGVGMADFETPRVLTIEEIHAIIKQYGVSAKLALEAGFDGVELHGANGYLPEQFLASSTNKRTDEFGGSVENRIKFIVLALEEILKVVPSSKVGIRLSPYGNWLDMSDDNPEETWGALIKKLAPMDLAYIHLIHPPTSRYTKHVDDKDVKTSLLYPFITSYRAAHPSSSAIFLAGGYEANTIIPGADYLENSAIVAGRLFISNPDLPERIKEGLPVNEYDSSTFYGGTEKGYTDYPTYKENPDYPKRTTPVKA